MNVKGAENLVSVVMAAYNASSYIQEAIDSIINQTHSNWELIIVDDGSTDETANIIAKNISQDKRIKSFYQENAKQSKARNLGIFHAKGKYIAVLDSDDISLPERLAKQVMFLEANQDYILCGSWFGILDSDRIIKCPEHDEVIKVVLLNGNCIAHSSVMIRKDALGFFPVIYDSSKEPSEDYDLYVRLVKYGKLYNLQEVLMLYRTHNNQLSKKQRAVQNQMACEIKRKLFSNLKFVLSPMEESVFMKILNNGIGIGFKDFNVIKKIQMKLLASNTENFFEPIGFKNFIMQLDKIIVDRYFLKRNQFYPKIITQYYIVKRNLKYKLSIKDELKLVLKSLVFYSKK
ncbi:glycosyltransferase family 2 protein [Flavisericum labens]|uniref:glycosyltransferase family 2 protein n=1 Tax=Flavisericum labens TaxID=3377112 RepID=UPI00387B865C